ncbi:putative nucleotidyltransferase substrate binding domain-containing protein [Gordonia sp. NB41Y]|uniref:putative nucleotidyltransferase substrate binding domain-containing protein n=1 Tax=Gordonia sp. NB41Y TaxID=875808 RepID=UPI00128F2FFE|nr:putative nucleotidyltransferase substrate binding domain-containing protein [Gordonia sp. NB41Y]WLP91145.1 putative nucleotidyltransferase substrate binding domain-containing protein [Gordonia sp. NB41Y]
MSEKHRPKTDRERRPWLYARVPERPLFGEPAQPLRILDRDTHADPLPYVRVDLVRFLRSHAPFDSLPPDTVARMLVDVGDETEPAGAVLVDGFTEPTDVVVAVISGRVGLQESTDTDGFSEVLGPGAVFGVSPGPGGELRGPRAVVVEKARICRIPGDAARRALRGRSSTGIPGLAMRLSVPRRRGMLPGGTGLVGDLLADTPPILDAHNTIRAAASAMATRGGPVCYRAADGTVRIVTDADLRDRIAAGGATDAPITEIGAAPTISVTTDFPVSDVITRILDHPAADHSTDVVAVVDPDGTLRGLLTPRELLATRVDEVTLLRAGLASAATVDELQDLTRRWPQLMADLVRRGRATQEITAAASSLLQTSLRRAITLTEAAHPDLAWDAVTWMCLGSVSRREVVPSSDVESAVILDDTVDATMRTRLAAAFGEVDTILAGGGIAPDDNGVRASAPLFARTRSEWGSAAAAWTDAPLENRGMLFTALLFDARPLTGDSSVSLGPSLFGDLRTRPDTVRSLLAESLSTRSRLRSVRDVLTRRAGVFDIKSHALTPLINLARWAAISVGATEVDTRSRLRAAAASPLLGEADSATLLEVLDVLQRVRLTYQVALLDRGEQPTDLITMSRLSPIDRSLIAQSVREIAAIQRRMAGLSALVGAGDLTTTD